MRIRWAALVAFALSVVEAANGASHSTGIPPSANGTAIIHSTSPASPQPEASVPAVPLDAQADRRDSELRAQWKAADGAFDQARWTKYSLIVGTIGTIGLLATLWYTRKAVKLAAEAGADADQALGIAEKNADAAAELVRVSQEVANRQLRPHVYVTHCTIGCEPMPAFGTIQDSAPVTLHIRNFGQTPATSVELRASAMIGGAPDTKFESNYDAFPGVPSGDLPPGFEKIEAIESLSGLQGAYQRLQKGEASIFLDGSITYSDFTGMNFETQFRFVSAGRDFSASRFALAKYGNSSS